MPPLTLLPRHTELYCRGRSQFCWSGAPGDWSALELREVSSEGQHRSIQLLSGYYYSRAKTALLDHVVRIGLDQRFTELDVEPYRTRRGLCNWMITRFAPHRRAMANATARVGAQPQEMSNGVLIASCGMIPSLLICCREYKTDTFAVRKHDTSIPTHHTILCQIITGSGASLHWD